MYNLVQRLIIIDPIALVIGLILGSIPNIDDKISLSILNLIASFLLRIVYLIKQFGIIITFIGILMLINIILLVILEAIVRIKHDSLNNLWQSIRQTMSTRKFLKLDNIPKSEINDQGKVIKKYDPIVERYNRKVLNTVVDVRMNTITMIIPKPKKNEPLKLLNNQKKDFRKEFTSRNRGYQFSEFNDNGKYLILSGTKTC